MKFKYQFGGNFKSSGYNTADKDMVIQTTKGPLQVNKGDVYVVGERELPGGKMGIADPKANKQGCTKADMTAALASEAVYLTRAQHKGIPSDGYYHISPTNKNCVYPGKGKKEVVAQKMPPITVEPEPVVPNQELLLSEFKPGLRIDISSDGVIAQYETARGDLGGTPTQGQLFGRTKDPLLVRAIETLGLKQGNHELDETQAKKFYMFLANSIKQNPALKTKEVDATLRAIKQNMAGRSSTIPQQLAPAQPKQMYGNQRQAQFTEIKKHGGTMKMQDKNAKQNDNTMSVMKKGGYMKCKSGCMDKMKKTGMRLRQGGLLKFQDGGKFTTLYDAITTLTGKPADFKTRKMLFEQLGMKNYTGTAEQNNYLLKELNKGDSSLKQSLSATKTKGTPTEDPTSAVVEGFNKQGFAPKDYSKEKAAYNKQKEDLMWKTGDDAITSIVDSIKLEDEKKNKIRNILKDSNRRYKLQNNRDMSYGEMDAMVGSILENLPKL